MKTNLPRKKKWKWKFNIYNMDGCRGMCICDVYFLNIRIYINIVSIDKHILWLHAFLKYCYVKFFMSICTEKNNSHKAFFSHFQLYIVEDCPQIHFNIHNNQTQITNKWRCPLNFMEKIFRFLLVDISVNEWFFSL